MRVWIFCPGNMISHACLDVFFVWKLNGALLSHWKLEVSATSAKGLKSGNVS